MHRENILPAILPHLPDGAIITAESLLEAFDAGKLTKFLEPGSWWLASFDEADRIASLTMITLEETSKHLMHEITQPGGLIILRPMVPGSETPHIQARAFPACDVAKQFNSSEAN